ncbi:MAG TPA: ABC transporter permease [Terriglobales bacterium]|nr:ABC transporter permease [Terriglobales bacterium]
MLADLRYALRTLRKSPGFAAVAILTLALAIGANTAIFSAVDAVLLRPLPYPDAGQLAGVWETNLASGNRIQVSGPDFGDWSRQTRGVFSGIAAYASAPLSISGDGIRPERVIVGAVGAGFFSTLRVNPELGRWFTAAEHRPGVTGATLLSDGLWRRLYGADPAVLGRTVVVDGVPSVIVGVMPPAFRFPDDAELWLPLEHWGVVDSGSRTAMNYRVVARLGAGVSLGKAQAAMTALAARLRRQYGTHTGALVVGLRRQLAGDLGPALWILLGAVGLLLLIACVNVANLLLARAAARRRDFALRAALGASRGRLLRQGVTEGLLLALLGGAAGLLVAAWGTAALRSAAAAILPSYAQVRLDAGVLLFTFGLALATGVLFGLAPAWQSARSDPHAALQTGGARLAAARGRLRSALVIAEVALSFVLLIGAGLMLRSLGALLAVPLGFQPQHLWVADVSLPEDAPAYSQPAAVARFFDQLLARVRALPGVTAAAAASALPLGNGQSTNGAFVIAGRPPAQENLLPYAEYREVTPGYFHAMGIALLRGRDFTSADTQHTPFVAVINQAAARRYWPGQNPLGQRMRFLGFTPHGAPPWMEIVGVVADTRISLAAPPRPAAFVAAAQQPYWMLGDAYVLVRGSFSAGALRAALVRIASSLDPQVPVRVGPFTARLDTAAAPSRFRAALLGLFAALALILAAVGLYGVLSFLVGERRKEVGIRLALGARPGQVLAAAIGEGVRWVVLGLAAGAVAAWFAGRLLARFLFGVSPADPLTFAAVALLLLAVAVLACWLPARRAARVDPVQALRCE